MAERRFRSKGLLVSQSKTLTDISDGDLLTQLAETKEELFNLRFQNATGQLDNYKRLGQVKKDIARINTELRAREIAVAEGESA
ncbi:MAG: 50S ribosomal protein L29 [Actinomycetia bacterium]|nr:50S ribosomal protein L29 [Actinomycetes bacterium]MCP4085406.1 50S ribosomal protein L29 [Actinomycetes bacterium]